VTAGISAPSTAPVVSTEWLAQNLGAEGLRVVDVRGKILPPGATPRYLPKRDDYEQGHVPGAVFVDWTRDIVDLDDPIPSQVARPEAFAAKMSELGIGDGTLVVVYDDYNHVFASRLAWALRFYGHDAVRVLDGGFTRWVAEGRPTTRETPTVAKGTFVARARGALRRTSDEVARTLGDPSVLLIDARAPAQYEGSATVAARGGHIPGARNVHYAKLVDASTGRFLPPEELARVFANAGVDLAKLPRDVVVYCNGGITCTLPLVALHILGRQDVAVFDGSWNEWGNDPSRPVATGPEP
jgi:thiosulfate/3-mercaptopyruvate sulfurtransferase